MPLQNRVTPFSAIEADPARGLFMGNRGCLHGAHKNLEVAQTREKRWLICLTNFKNRKRRLMHPGAYTELFFLDEATALAAGHRPCAECRRQSYDAFLKLFPGKRANAEQLDRALASQRLRPYPEDFAALPDGAMVEVDGQALLKWRGKAFAWRHAGYAPAPVPSGPVEVLTPEGTVEAIAKGYKPVVHASVNAPPGR
jgi:hypothetical protein